MIRLSSGILNYAISLMSLTHKFSEINLIQIKSHSLFNGININDVIETSIKCQWLIYKEDHLLCTEAGKRILEIHSTHGFTDNLLRIMIQDYIFNCSPIWANRIPRGRKEAFFVMSVDEQKCFIDANLMHEPPEKNVINWWDDISESLRFTSESNLLAIGRCGELLSFKYEWQRTGATPILQSLNTNLVGYDIISQLSKSDAHRLLIEVKTSGKGTGSESFLLTRNEWETAYQAENYLIHLWKLSPTPQLAVITPSDISSHIPINQGAGKWIKVDISFTVFQDRFFEVQTIGYKI